MIIGCVIALPFIHSIAFQKLALALIMKFVLLKVWIIVGVIALAAFVLSFFAVELEIA